MWLSSKYYDKGIIHQTKRIRVFVKKPDINKWDPVGFIKADVCMINGNDFNFMLNEVLCIRLELSR